MAGRIQKPVRYLAEDRGYETPCWIWQLALQPNGYGHFADRRSGYAGSAHRWFWEQLRGPAPKRAHIDHLCRVRACVNPAHMELVTNAENARRGANAKLTYDDVEEIKRLRATGLFQREVAEIFGVCRRTIGDIEQGRTWAAPGGVILVGA
jgi:DNA-binding XRE family transcriptional regulator